MTRTTKIIPIILLSAILIGATFAFIDIQSAFAGPPPGISVLVVESADNSNRLQNQLANKFVQSAFTTIGGSGLFALTSIGPTAMATIPCSTIQTFDVVYVPINSAAAYNALVNNPALAQCFTSAERAVITGYHADQHQQLATGQFLFDALTWIDGGSQVGLLVLNDFRQSPLKYDFLQPMFPGVFASVRNQVVPYQDITFLTTPPHPTHANTSDGVQNIGDLTMDNWNQTCHSIWDTLGPGNGGYEDDGFIAVSEGRSNVAGPHVCAIAKDGIILVDVDIKPGSFPSSVDCTEKQPVPVAVFGSGSFDVSTIDLTTLELNGFPVTEVHDKIHIEDVKKDGIKDGIPDAVLHLDRAQVCEATLGAPLKESVDATLTGSTTGGPAFTGKGDIRIVKR